MHLAEILVNDVSVLLEIYALCILAWAFMSFFPEAYATPVGHLLEALVMPVIRPLRRVLPPIAGLDFSPLLALILVFALAELLQKLASSDFANPVSIIFSVIFEFISAVALVIVVLLLIRVLITALHLDPWHPFVYSIKRITDRLIAPIERAAKVQTEMAAVIGLVIAIVVYIALAEVLFPSLLNSLQQI
ncbi:MAG TPA: YggT family protein [Candidatus Dormibacteraeota bacterium]|nr:YggT family protein [Candidatus Dormibacteraeota bacterium]